jgi:PBP1b-binding outer membrane lipoprotein LpoB
MKNIIIRILIFILILNSCDNRVIADFEVTNTTEFKIDSLKIEPMVISDGQYISLKPIETVKYKADMTGIAKADGSYRLSYKQNGELIITDFGYYTNGYPTEKLTRIKIEVDTVKFDAEFRNY